MKFKKKIIKNTHNVAQKQHGIIKCDRNVWNVLHVRKKRNAHTYMLENIERGRRHENACKITEQKNGNTARATVNNNTTAAAAAVATFAAESLVRILSLQLVRYLHVCLCAMADGRTVKYHYETIRVHLQRYALVLRLTNVCANVKSKI